MNKIRKIDNNGQDVCLQQMYHLHCLRVRVTEQNLLLKAYAFISSHFCVQEMKRKDEDGQEELDKSCNSGQQRPHSHNQCNIWDLF